MTAARSLYSFVFPTIAIVLSSACSGDAKGPTPTPTQPVTDRIEITQPGAPLRVGAAFDLTARAVTSTGQPTGSAVTWTSSDSSVIRIGTPIQIIGPGTATLNASADGKQASIVVSVIQSPVVSAGGRNTCAIDRNGALSCWGSAEWDLLMGESTKPALSPLRMAHGRRFTQVALGPLTACAATSLGETYCWGRTYGATPVLLPTRMAKLFSNSGATTFCGIGLDRAAYCWGDGQYGQLGNGSKVNSVLPVRVNTSLEFASLAIGATVCGLTSAGAASCWGADWRGASANACGAPACVLTPTALSNMNVRSVVVMGVNTPYVLVGADLYAISDQPRSQASQLRFLTMTNGDSHICGLAMDGAAFCRGANVAGQLGTGDFDARLATDAAVAGSFQFRSISAGREHTCGVTLGDEVYCWGTNLFGELGRGVASGRENTAVRVTLPESP